MSSAPERICCCVPFCRRTFKNDKGYGWIICGKHWRLADKSLRRRRTKLLRRYKKEMDRAKRRRLVGMILWLDERGKRQAIERALGI